MITPTEERYRYRYNLTAAQYALLADICHLVNPRFDMTEEEAAGIVQAIQRYDQQSGGPISALHPDTWASP